MPGKVDKDIFIAKRCDVTLNIDCEAIVNCTTIDSTLNRPQPPLCWQNIHYSRVMARLKNQDIHRKNATINSQ